MSLHRDLPYNNAALLREYAALCRAAWAVALANQSIEADAQDLRDCLRGLDWTWHVLPLGVPGRCVRGIAMCLTCHSLLRKAVILHATSILVTKT